MLETYWDSPEAKKLFLGNSTDNRSVVDVLRERIQRLQQVNRTQDGWRDLVDKHDVDNLCSAYDVFYNPTEMLHSVFSIHFGVGRNELCSLG